LFIGKFREAFEPAININPQCCGMPVAVHGIDVQGRLPLQAWTESWSLAGLGYPGRLIATSMRPDSFVLR